MLAPTVADERKDAKGCGRTQGSSQETGVGQDRRVAGWPNAAKSPFATHGDGVCAVYLSSRHDPVGTSVRSHRRVGCHTNAACLGPLTVYPGSAASFQIAPVNAGVQYGPTLHETSAAG